MERDPNAKAWVAWCPALHTCTSPRTRMVVTKAAAEAQVKRWNNSLSKLPGKLDGVCRGNHEVRHVSDREVEGFLAGL